MSTREERDAEGRLNAIDLDAQPDCKRSKTENAAPSSVASLSTSATPSGTAGVERVTGLVGLLEDLSESVCVAALEWCDVNEVTNVKLILEAGAEEEFVAALPIKPAGIPATALRRRLSKMRDMSQCGECAAVKS
mgnify:CR=1 FL=1